MESATKKQNGAIKKALSWMDGMVLDIVARKYFTFDQRPERENYR